MINVLYAGDYAIIATTFYKAMNSFSYAELFDERKFLMDPMKSDKDVNITYLPTPKVSEFFPSTKEELAKYDVVILSDVGTDTILLYPDRFKIPMGANRIKLIQEFVQNGGGLVVVGGWMTFGGQMGQGKYHGTVIEDILDCDISPFDDRIEVPEGLKFNPVKKNHPLVKDIGWEKSPLLFLGYNRFKARNPENVIAEHDGDPMMAINSYGKGRALAFASDVAPHWGQGFVNWENYAKFWSRCFRWLSQKEK